MNLVRDALTDLHYALRSFRQRPGFFGVIVALFLAAAGIHGVISYMVVQRSHEIGIRMALGARWRQVASLVLAEVLGLVLVGLALGIAASLATTRWVASQLFEITPTDPPTYAVITLLLLVVALLASYAPLRRATRLDPLVALRSV